MSQVVDRVSILLVGHKSPLTKIARRLLIQGMIYYSEIQTVGSGGLIREYRRKHNLSQAALASLLGVKQGDISRWEISGRPELATAIKLAELIGAPLEEWYPELGKLRKGLK
jgi:DNA-binding XRE family transcriptional regulator